MDLTDTANSVGYYTDQVTLTSTPYDLGKSYDIYIVGTSADSVVGTTHHNFQIGLNVGTIVGSTPFDMNAAMGDIVADKNPITEGDGADGAITYATAIKYIFYRIIGKIVATETLETYYNAADAAAYKAVTGTTGSTTTRSEATEINP